MKADAEFHSTLVLREWDNLISMVGQHAKGTTIDGVSLDLATIVAVAR
jgi:hypothetical protein